MARSKTFEPDEKLREAMQVFWVYGFEGASMQQLLDAMQICRQSLYDTFGDKRQLFLRALKLYDREQSKQRQALLNSEKSARKALHKLFLGLAAETVEKRHRGCLMVKVVAEGLTSDDEASAIIARNARSYRRSLQEVLARGVADGEFPASLAPGAGASYLFTVLQGLWVSAQSGASANTLRKSAQMALHTLEQK